MAKAESNEIRLVRVYNAPVELVWECYTEVKHKANWWGPRGFTISTKSKDLRPGGNWVYTMHGPDGKDWPNFTTYHVVDKYSKLVYDHGASAADQKPLFRVTVTFEELNGKTTMEMTMALESEAAAKEISKHIKQAGGNSTWDRLAEYLEEEQTKNDIFVINRTFEAAVATIFEMWTKPEYLSRWLAPVGFTMKVLQGEIKAGSETFYSMGDGDTTMYGKMFYKEINPVTRLVYTQQFSDKDQNLSRHPHAPTWPATMKSTITFAEESPNQTRVTVKWEVYGDATVEECKMFHDAKSGMTQGWTGSFDKLEELLKRNT
jgi:uncharacterized protein YndB with AHSA1/START domain